MVTVAAAGVDSAPFCDLIGRLVIIDLKIAPRVATETFPIVALQYLLMVLCIVQFRVLTISAVRYRSTFIKLCTSRFGRLMFGLSSHRLIQLTLVTVVGYFCHARSTNVSIDLTFGFPVHLRPRSRTISSLHGIRSLDQNRLGVKEVGTKIVRECFLCHLSASMKFCLLFCLGLRLCCVGLRPCQPKRPFRPRPDPRRMLRPHRRPRPAPRPSLIRPPLSALVRVTALASYQICTMRFSVRLKRCSALLIIQTNQVGSRTSDAHICVDPNTLASY